MQNTKDETVVSYEQEIWEMGQEIIRLSKNNKIMLDGLKEIENATLGHNAYIMGSTYSILIG